MDTKNKVFVVIGSVALLATAGLGGAYLFGAKDTPTGSTTGMSSTTSTSSSSTPTTSTSTTTDTSSSSSTTSSSSSYKDGTYTASTSYSVPHGATNTISATVVVSGGNITSVTADDNYTDRESGMWISDFESSLSSTVNGTSLADASFSRIGGASLTTEGFNAVLDMIRTQATA